MKLTFQRNRAQNREYLKGSPALSMGKMIEWWRLAERRAEFYISNYSDWKSCECSAVLRWCTSEDKQCLSGVLAQASHTSTLRSYWRTLGRAHRSQSLHFRTSKLALRLIHQGRSQRNRCWPNYHHIGTHIMRLAEILHWNIAKG